MQCVLLTQESILCWNLPIDAEGVILDTDATISLRMIELIAFVLEDSGLRENSEAMGKTTRDEKLTMIVFCQFHCHMLSECRLAFTDVNGYVKDCAFDATHEFALSIGHALIVQTTHHAV